MPLFVIRKADPPFSPLSLKKQPPWLFGAVADRVVELCRFEPHHTIPRPSHFAMLKEL
ncbi:hypothetical protein C8N43_0611 [Litoreibacter ponti]|uniref:Uncharacterized protein n=1 Tax=Litoreibacter ponti TaxID=1510457 RepID=A0A2T6BIT2_9RHOB|nr:hypothetical protein [Litoreibacter ponti]PTX55962.1 hypothetical protein C8N43_0611 [Litoreibacter ponti]